MNLQKNQIPKNHLAWRALLARPPRAFRYGVRISLAATLLFLSYHSAFVMAAQEAITGEWIIKAKPGTDYVHLTIQRGSVKHFNSMSTLDVRQENIRGLSQALAAGNGSPVRFQIVRDAGTFDCEGWFKEGRGSGHFTFTPSQSFASDMASLGYANLSGENIFSMAVLDVSRA